MKATALFRIVASAGLLWSGAASAAVTFYDSAAAFFANATATLEADFEGLAEGNSIPNPYTEGRVTVSDPSNLYVMTPGGIAATCCTTAPVLSTVLTVNGDERFSMTFSGPAPTAVGFVSLTNGVSPYIAPTVTVFDVANVQIGFYALTQAPSTADFVGIVSDTPIGRVDWFGAQGGIINTAIDDIYVGAVPEPSTYLLMLAGLLGLGFSARRRAAS